MKDETQNTLKTATKENIKLHTCNGALPAQFDSTLRSTAKEDFWFIESREEGSNMSSGSLDRRFSASWARSMAVVDVGLMLASYTIAQAARRSAEVEEDQQGYPM